MGYFTENRSLKEVYQSDTSHTSANSELSQSDTETTSTNTNMCSKQELDETISKLKSDLIHHLKAEFELIQRQKSKH